MLIRLQKFFTDCGVLSRRAAEAEIEKGNVTVNGVTATTGQKVDPKKDKILWNNAPVVYDPKKKNRLRTAQQAARLCDHPVG